MTRPPASAANAPSNIALIKYMGKSDPLQNIPGNGSLSYTLDHYRTFVEIHAIPEGRDEWSSLAGDGLYPIELSDHGRKKFLDHFSFLKKFWGLQSSFHIRSANNFPSDCGLASSASSFAALTMAAGHLAGVSDPLQLANLSRRGSGSSCRSFFSPWCEWRGEKVFPVEMSLKNLLHLGLIVDSQKKVVSSSVAHKRVTTSLLFEGRPERAEIRLESLKTAFQKNLWREAFEICWAEFWDMHALFETSQPSFSYFTPKCVELLTVIKKSWSEDGAGPLVTMDAGPNIHLLFMSEHLELAQKYKELLQPLVEISSAF